MEILRKYIAHLLFSIILAIYILPAFGAIDKISPQFLFLSISCLFTSIFLFFQSKSGLSKSNFHSIILLGLFILTGGFSIIVAYNKIESLVILSQYSVYFTVFALLSFIVKKIDNIPKFFYSLTLIILSAEVFTILVQLTTVLDSLSFENFNRTNEIKGVAGNINIAAFSICYKLPIIIFSKKRLNWYSSIIVFLSIFCVFLMGTRGAYLAYFLILLAFIFYSIVKRETFSKPTLFKASTIVLPFIFSILILNTSRIDVIERAGSISLSTQDGSVNQRLRYYNHAISSFIENPFGIGIGNWKVKSIDYDKDNIFQYIIPYHAHNDYLQILAEQGVFGLLFFIMFLFYPILNALKFGFKKAFKFWPYLVSTAIYILDSTINFPIARPINAIYLISTLVVLNELVPNKEILIDKNKSRRISIILMVLLIPIQIITAKHFISYRFQSYLIGEWAGSQLSIPLEPIKQFDESIPNLSATGIPLSAMKGRYFLRDGKNEEAISYFNDAEKENSTIAISDNLKSQFYFQRKNIDSAYIYSKRAFEKLPNNTIHASVYFDILSVLGKREELKNAFKKINLKDYDISFYTSYYQALLRIDSSRNLEISNEIKALLNKVPSKELESLYKKFKLGEDDFNESARLSNLASEEYEKKNFLSALEIYGDAIRVDDQNVEFYENRGIIYFKLNKYQKALQEFDYVINTLKNSNSGKSEFYKAVILIDQKSDNKSLICTLLKISDKKGFNGAKSITNNYCN